MSADLGRTDASVAGTGGLPVPAARTAAAGFLAYRPEDPVPTAGLTQTGSAHFASLYAHARKLTDAATDGIDPESSTRWSLFFSRACNVTARLVERRTPQPAHRRLPIGS
jgi:hypothetical protein